jgi:hypothetical protein
VLSEDAWYVWFYSPQRYVLHGNLHKKGSSEVQFAQACYFCSLKKYITDCFR